jgi:hypothetical protein
MKSFFHFAWRSTVCAALSLIGMARVEGSSPAVDVKFPVAPISFYGFPGPDCLGAGCESCVRL